MQVTGQENVERRRLCARRLLAAAINVFCAWMIVNAAPTFADAYQPALTQYAHTAWRVQDGDFEGQPSSITQTNDGYLWIGTESGLRRYDGTSFQRWPLPREGVVYSILADRDGSLWVGRGDNLVHSGIGKPTVLVPTRGRVDGLYQDELGAIWLARSRGPARAGGLCKMADLAVRCFGAAQKQPCEFAVVVKQDSQGSFWIGGDAGICTWRPDAGGELLAKGGIPNQFGVQALAVEPDGSVLVGYARAGPHLGLERASGGRLKSYSSAGVNGESLKVTALLRDRDDALWIGTAGDGIYHIIHGRADHFTPSDGLSGNGVNAIFQDREGSVWVATTGGLDRFHGRPILAITTREGLVSDQANSVLVRREGSVWASSTEGVSIIRDGKAVSGAAPAGLLGHSITSMAEDDAGRLWVGLDDDLWVAEGGHGRIIRKSDGGKLGVLVGLAQDRSGDMWALAAGRPYRLYRINREKSVEEMPVPGRQTLDHLAVGPDGAIWIADIHSDFQIYKNGRWTPLSGPKSKLGYSEQVLLAPNGDAVLSTNGGAYYLRGGRWTLLDASRGLPCDNLFSAIFDQKGALWLRGQCGMMTIARSDLDHALDRPSAKVSPRLLDTFDGAQPGEASFQPAVAMSRNGQLWFATDNALLTVNPANVSSNSLQPPTHIEQLIADHRTYGLDHAIALPPRSRDVEITYSGLSLVAPQKVRFRYRLSGVDADWQDVGTRRAAFYMNLKPGPYRFQVIASNNDGIWNTIGDSLDFTIRPTFYQTLWFQLLVTVFLIGLLWLGVWLRVRYVTAEIETRLSERQAERMRIARELHDTLLQGFQGLLMRFQVVADAIPKRSPAKPMMEAVLSRAEEVLVEGRDRVHDLRTADVNVSPLLDELHRLALGLEQDGCGPIEVRCIGVPRALDSEAQLEILGIAKEALTNAFRHAQATKILCQVVFTVSHVRLSCEDDGVGIDAGTMKAGGRPGHWGLTGMRERARKASGVLTIQSAPGRTQISFSLNTWLADFRRSVRRLKPLQRFAQ